MAKTAKQHVENGVKALKVKVGTGRNEDLARIRAIREAVGSGVPMRLDANQAWDEITAINILTALAEYEIEVCEQPLPYWNIEGLKRVRERSPIAIMADESIFGAHDAFRLASLGAVDYFNIKLAKSAGIHGALKINAIGEAAGNQMYARRHVRVPHRSQRRRAFGLRLPEHFSARPRLSLPLCRRTLHRRRGLPTQRHRDSL